MANNSPESSNVVSRVIDFLARNGALELGHVPWTTYEDSEDVVNVDYSELMSDPRNESPEKSWGVPEDFAAEVNEILARTSDGLNPFPHDRERTARPTDTRWDTCAWYQPMHFFATDWGVFIKEECLLRLALVIAANTDGARLANERARGLPPRGKKNYWRLDDAELLIRAAFTLLFLHEHFHHRMECLGLRLHVITRSPLYVPYFRAVYTPALGTDDLLEEALANACMYRRLSEEAYTNLLPEAIRDAMRAMLLATYPTNPPGYRKAIDYLGEREFDHGENVLQGWMRESTMNPKQPAPEWDLAPRMTQSFFTLSSNIYSVVPKGAKVILPRNAFPTSCSTQEMIRLCRHHGYEIQSGAGKGSHLKMEKSGAPMVVLPHRRDLSPGVIKNTLAALGEYKLRDLPKLLNTI